MRKTIIATLLATPLALAGCIDPENEDLASGAALGAVFGGITAAALGADTEWLIIGTLAGAAAGALVAENQRTGECAYSNGDGTYYRAACP